MKARKRHEMLRNASNPFGSFGSSWNILEPDVIGIRTVVNLWDKLEDIERRLGLWIRWANVVVFVFSCENSCLRVLY